MTRDFWASLTENSSSQLLTAAMDTHLSGKAIGESFEGVRTLTDAGRAKQALSLPVEVGTRVAFVGGLGAVLTYEHPPEAGHMGTVVHVQSAGGNLTSHDGKVFVSWDDGRFLPVHAEHLRAAGGVSRTAETKPQGVAQAALLAYFKDMPAGTTEELGDVVRHPSFRRMDFGQVMSAAKALAKKGVFKWDGSAITKVAAAQTAGRVEQHVSTMRVASLGDLTSFFMKVGTDTLIHKSTRDLWALKQDAGGFLVERLFDDSGEPLKG
jgi:hypothetical protein